MGNFKNLRNCKKATQLKNQVNNHLFCLTKSTLSNYISLYILKILLFKEFCVQKNRKTSTKRVFDYFSIGSRLLSYHKKSENLPVSL